MFISGRNVLWLFALCKILVQARLPACLVLLEPIPVKLVSMWRWRWWSLVVAWRGTGLHRQSDKNHIVVLPQQESEQEMCDIPIILNHRVYCIRFRQRMHILCAAQIRNFSTMCCSNKMQISQKVKPRNIAESVKNSKLLYVFWQHLVCVCVCVGGGGSKVRQFTFSNIWSDCMGMK